MSQPQPVTKPDLAAKSPFEMRVHLGDDVPETDVRAALKTGDMGFLHSFTTGSTVDGPGVRVVAWTTGCMWRCRYCHNPDTWTMKNGIPVAVTKAIEELSKYRHGLKITKSSVSTVDFYFIESFSKEIVQKLVILPFSSSNNRAVNSNPFFFSCFELF
jgi:pyruvate formate lyase activating enzyme